MDYVSYTCILQSLALAFIWSNNKDMRINMTKIKVMIPTQQSNDIQKGYFNLYMCFLTSKPTSGGKGLSLSIKENSSIKEREDQNSQSVQTLPKTVPLGWLCTDRINPQSVSPWLLLPTPSPCAAPVCKDLHSSRCPQTQTWVLLRAVTPDKLLQSWHGNLRPLPQTRRKSAPPHLY